MQSIRPRFVLASVALAALAACHDNATAPVKPASIEIAGGNELVGTAGQKLTASPSFLVKDENGRALSGVAIRIAVTMGGGSIANPPRTSGGGPTSIGTWILGFKAGLNQLTVSVAGLPPIVFNATATAGPAARITTTMPTTFPGRVGELASPAPIAKVVDTYGNPIAGITVRATLTGGGSVTQPLTTDATGTVTLSEWTLGQKVGQDVLTLSAGTGALSFIANKSPGDPAKVVAVSGNAQSGPAGAPLPAPILVHVTDRFDNTVIGPSATFAVTSGGGTVASGTASPDANGSITVPMWTLGRTALPQVVHITAGQASGDITATVQTDYRIDVRFFGPPMTDAQKALFTNAAARLSAIITGDLADVIATNLDVASACGLPGLPVLNETIDDIVIYASVQDIDGAGKILAEAGPCGFRNRAAGFLTTLGVMEFDVADIERMATNGTLQDVITHEMLHVLGIGTLWSSQRLTQNEGTVNVTYVGLSGKQGCVDSGGSTTCAIGVPVENNGVVGTADSHWRESVFQSELMTGYVNLGGMPLSAVTAGSLQDLGYAVNMLAADPFRIPVAPSSASIIEGEGGWEKPLPSPGALISPSGIVTPIKRP